MKKKLNIGWVNIIGVGGGAGCKNNDFFFLNKMGWSHSREEEGGTEGDLKSFFLHFVLILFGSFFEFGF